MDTISTILLVLVVGLVLFVFGIFIYQIIKSITGKRCGSGQQQIAGGNSSSFKHIDAEPEDWVVGNYNRRLRIQITMDGNLCATPDPQCDPTVTVKADGGNTATIVCDSKDNPTIYDANGKRIADGWMSTKASDSKQNVYIVTLAYLVAKDRDPSWDMQINNHAADARCFEDKPLTANDPGLPVPILQPSDVDAVQEMGASTVQFSPKSGRAFQEVLLYSEDFPVGQVQVYFGDQRAQILGEPSQTHIIARVPEGLIAEGETRVKITVRNGEVTCMSDEAFQVMA